MRRKKHCYYCKRQLSAPSDRSRTAATRDHIRPKHEGGRRTVPCCRQCNQLKGGMSIEEWRGVMSEFPEWWKRFAHQGELIETRRRAIWANHRRKQEMGRFPRDIRLPPAPLCKGLNYYAIKEAMSLAA